MELYSITYHKSNLMNICIHKNNYKIYFYLSPFQFPFLLPYLPKELIKVTYWKHWLVSYAYLHFHNGYLSKKLHFSGIYWISKVFLFVWRFSYKFSVSQIHSFSMKHFYYNSLQLYYGIISVFFRNQYYLFLSLTI